MPGYNKAVQVGRTVINFSVKHLQKPDATLSVALGETVASEVIDDQNAGAMGAMGVVKANTR